MKYCSKIIDIGKEVENMTSENMLILFSKEAPDALIDYCIIHENEWPVTEFEVGDEFYLGENRYIITAYGEVAKEYLKNLGHVTLKFDGAKEAAMSGYIHLEGKIAVPKINEDIIIL